MVQQSNRKWRLAGGISQVGGEDRLLEKSVVEAHRTNTKERTYRAPDRIGTVNVEDKQKTELVLCFEAGSLEKQAACFLVVKNNGFMRISPLPGYVFCLKGLYLITVSIVFNSVNLAISRKHLNQVAAFL
ncbi:hypothetical protein [Allobaculum sp. JKK-2023]|uniref:hypothetical protein n=1 Tax=Allobaculum sp. JKK-2023 TaxID=3108943 RepID=UPI002B051F8B|nr:hypothetical protein [Allobaculum sp. JKK-2023]